ncbi:MAG: hypothetical protein PHC75_09420 [Burkholderiales bacterium]|nr:hypothetical protein [Burkholderiales bacterium]
MRNFILSLVAAFLVMLIPYKIRMGSHISSFYYPQIYDFFDDHISLVVWICCFTSLAMVLIANFFITLHYEKVNNPAHKIKLHHVLTGGLRILAGMSVCTFGIVSSFASIIIYQNENIMLITPALWVISMFYLAIQKIDRQLKIIKIINFNSGMISVIILLLGLMQTITHN